jgi:heat shock protein HslJ
MPHPASVTLRHGAERLSGCGGDPGALLHSSAWTLRALDGASLPSDRPLELLFGTDGRFAGQGSCNRLVGGYRLSGEGLRLGPVAGKMMACPEPLVAAERRYVEALEKVGRFDFALEREWPVPVTEDGRLVELALAWTSRARRLASCRDRVS